MQPAHWHKLIRTLIIAAMPFFLGLGMIFLVIHWNWPNYAEWEYGRIPPDRLGLTTQQRLALAYENLRYLRHTAPAEETIHLLEDLRLPDGAALYNQREIDHMLDVKHVTDALRNIWGIAGLLVSGGWLYFMLKLRDARQAWQAILWGGVLTVGILLAIALFILLAWDLFFVQFHELLFPPGTWTFAYTDGLIRLFPERFWFDVGVLISGGALLLGIATAVAGYVMVKKTR